MINKKRTILLFLLSGFFLILGFFTPYAFSSSNSGESFGGRVTYTTPCTCGEGYQVTVSGGKHSGTYLYSSTSKAYKAYFVSSGRNLLGKYKKEKVQCMVYRGNSCQDIGISKGPITMFGASF